MAKKPSPRKTGPAKGASKDIEDRLIDAMLALAETEGWRGLTVAAIARDAGVSLADLHPRYGSRVSILTAFVRRIDRTVMAGDFGFSPEDTKRDRLFAVLMRRFDALLPHREALRRIRSGLLVDPLAAAAVLPVFGCSMAWMLETAEIASDGCAGHARTAGLAGVWVKTMRVWLNDDTADLAQTMAALDRNLGRAGRCAEMLFGRAPRAATEGA